MKALLEAGVHFGHQTRRWNPKMAPYIYTERNGIYIIDLQKTVKKLEEAYNFVRSVSESGQNILFVGTKKQAQEAIKEEASRCGGYYVNARWLGGMMTNFKTMRTRVDRLNQLKAMQTDGTFDMLPKKEVMKHMGEIAKLEKYLGGEEITEDEIKAVIRKGTVACKLCPVTCGTSYRNKGVQPLLDAIVDYMPAPTDIPPIAGINPETGEEEEILIENTETRDQPKNRAKALLLLKSQLYDRAMKKRLEAKAKIEAGKKKIEWGSQIRSYVFDDRRVKDHRTNYQTSDVDGVMDGKIDDFIKAYLMEFPTNDDEQQ